MDAAEIWGSIGVPVFTGVVALFSGVNLFRIRAERRQINAGAGKDEATSAEILTGAALAMVKHAEEEAQRAKAEAISAREDATAARRRAENAEASATESAKISVDCAREVMEQVAIRQRLERYILDQGLPLPIP